MDAFARMNHVKRERDFGKIWKCDARDRTVLLNCEEIGSFEMNKTDDDRQLVA